MEAFIQDIRYAVRHLRRFPGFATAAVLTVAFGVGVDTADSAMPRGSPPSHALAQSRAAVVPPVSRHSDLDDIRMYYKTAGAGPAIVFLHGGFGSSKTWDAYFALLSDKYTVIAPDSRGQGRTSLGNGPVTYGRMANDVVRLLDHLGIPRAHFVGHSDGGCTLFHLLIDYPDRVVSGTLIGAPYHTDNYPPHVYATLKAFVANLGVAAEPSAKRLRAAFEAESPTPSAWPELVRRLGRTWLTLPTFTEAELGLIKTPVLIVKVNRDQFLPPTFFDKSAGLIAGAQVLNLGEATHSVPTEMPGELGKGIRHFIERLDSRKGP